MAFFCPIFPKQQKIKAKEYEDTNYFSFDSINRGLYSSRSMTALNIPIQDEDFKKSTPDSSNSARLMMVNSDFDPTVDDELKVHRGDLVKALYRDREWIYVVRDQHGSSDIVQEGFIPLIYCDPIATDSKNGRQKISIFKTAFSRRSARRKSTNDQKFQSMTFTDIDQSINHQSIATKSKALMNVDRFLKSLDEERPSNSEYQEQEYARINKEKKSEFGRIMEFTKMDKGRLIVDYDFHGQNEGDLDIRKGEILILLNNDDPNWYWVRKENGNEGFVPSNYVRKWDELDSGITNPTNSNGQVQFNELHVIADFEPEAADDLRVIRGDWIYSYQTPALSENSWLWAYCPRTKRYGFVPHSVVRMPVSTIL